MWRVMRIIPGQVKCLLILAESGEGAPNFYNNTLFNKNFNKEIQRFCYFKRAALIFCDYFCYFFVENCKGKIFPVVIKCRYLPEA
jgi:hypothetical protein